MEIGKQIAKNRKELGITQEDLAERINVSRQAVTKWEAGEAVPELEKMIALADFFDVSLDKLVGRDETKYDKVKASIDRLTSRCTREYDEDISPMIQRYMRYMEGLNMEPDIILNGLLAMCEE